MPSTSSSGAIYLRCYAFVTTCHAVCRLGALFFSGFVNNFCPGLFPGFPACHDRMQNISC
jgi:hypothetical protein